MTGTKQERMSLRNAAPTIVLAALFLIVCAVGGARDAWAQAAPEIVHPKVLTYKTARSYDFGTFCISNIPPGTVTSVEGPDIAADGDWWEIELHVPQGAPARPRIHFLGGTRRQAGFYTACRATAAADVHRILEADILEGTVRFQILDPIASYGRAVQIKEGDLDIVLGHIQADLSSIYGGKVQSSKIQFEVVNPAPFIANPGNLNNPDDNLLTGRLQLLSYLLVLEDAALYLPEASTALRATLRADKVEGATFQLEIPSGQLSLYKGGSLHHRSRFARRWLRGGRGRVLRPGWEGSKGRVDRPRRGGPPGDASAHGEGDLRKSGTSHGALGPAPALGRSHHRRHPGSPPGRPGRRPHGHGPKLGMSRCPRLSWRWVETPRHPPSRGRGNCISSV